MRPPERPSIDRITLRSILGRVLEELHLARGFGYTVRLLIVRPREAVSEYLFKDRSRLVRPTTLLLLTVGVATFLSLEFLIGEDSLTELEGLEDLPPRVSATLTLMFQGAIGFFNLTYMSTLIPMAAATYFVFRRWGFNFAEHIVLNAYLFGIQTLGFILVLPLLVMGVPGVSWVGLLPLVHMFWFYKDVFETTWLGAFGRTLAAFIVGQMLWFGVLVAAFLLIMPFA